VSVRGFYDTVIGLFVVAHSHIATTSLTRSSLGKFFTPEVSGFKIRPVHPTSKFLATKNILNISQKPKVDLIKKDVYKD
jgi:hypothetical protein